MLTDQQKRFLEVYNAANGKSFTLSSLAASLKITADQFLLGRKLKFVLGDLVADKLATKTKDKYVFTSTVETLAPIEPVYSTADFLNELDSALQIAEPQKVRDFHPIGAGKEVTKYEVPQSSIIIPSEVIIPDAPVKPLPKTKKEAQVNFEANFTNDPNKAVSDLANLVIDLRTQVAAQEFVITQMHELLLAYVKHRAD